MKDLAEKKRGLEVLLRHLEGDPGPMTAKHLPGDESYGKVGVLCLDISSITGKRH